MATRPVPGRRRGGTLRGRLVAYDPSGDPDYGHPDYGLSGRSVGRLRGAGHGSASYPGRRVHLDAFRHPLPGAPSRPCPGAPRHRRRADADRSARGYRNDPGYRAGNRLPESEAVENRHPAELWLRHETGHRCRDAACSGSRRLHHPGRLSLGPRSPRCSWCSWCCAGPGRCHPRSSCPGRSRPIRSWRPATSSGPRRSPFHSQAPRIPQPRLPTSSLNPTQTSEEGRSTVLGATLFKHVRRRPTLPRGPPRSTIGAEGLNFRVRNGTGCFPFAITAETLLRCHQP